MKQKLFAAVLAAAVLLTGCGRAVPQEETVSGGYVEQRIPLPDPDFYCTGIFPNVDGSVTLYGASTVEALYRQEGWQGGAVSYIVQPDGTVTGQLLPWDEELAAACSDGAYRVSMAADEAGTLYLLAGKQNTQPEDTPFRLWRVENGALVSIPVDFTGCELLTGNFGDGLFCTLDGVSEGWLFVSANNGHWAVFSTEGKLVNQYEPSAQGSGASFYASAVRNGYAWDGSNGYAPAYTLPEMEKASSLTLPMGTIFPDWEGEGFYHLSYENEQERILSHYTLSGDTREILMHGSDYAWGPESTSAFTGCAASDGALWLLVESGGGQTLCRYVYDPAKTVENTLTVYSLEESALVRQAIAEWNNLHPETRFEYTVGMTNAEGTGATREDVIRQLNTELLAGTGPDLLILDGLAGDSLIRQGLLTDLTGLADWSAVRENVLAAYTREDGLYAVPMGMRAYIVGGRPDTVDDRLLSLSGITDAMEQSGEANACLAFSGSLYEQIFDLFYPASADAIWRDGQFQPDAYTEFTEQLNRIARAAGAKTIQASTAGEEPEMEGAANAEFYAAGYSAGTLNNFWNGEGRWFAEGWGSAVQATAFSLLQRDEEGSLTGSAPGEVTLYPMPGVEGTGALEPLCAAALPVNSENQALALDFLQLMLSDTVQSAAGLDALPVTESGLAAALDRVRQTDPFTVTNGENAVLDSLTAVIPDTVLQAAAREAAARLYDGELTPETACQAVKEAAALRLAEQN